MEGEEGGREKEEERMKQKDMQFIFCSPSTTKISSGNIALSIKGMQNPKLRKIKEMNHFECSYGKKK